MIKIIDLLKMLKFERFLHRDHSHSYYKFQNKSILTYFYDKELNKNVLTLSSGGINTIIDDESEIIKTILSHFKDNVDVIREFKFKTIGL